LKFYFITVLSAIIFKERIPHSWMAGILVFSVVTLVLWCRCTGKQTKRQRRKRHAKSLSIQTQIEPQDEHALAAVKAKICAWLFSICPDSKWKWVYCPANFAQEGGIAQIETTGIGLYRYFDVCLCENGDMTMHVSQLCELHDSLVAPTQMPEPDNAHSPIASNIEKTGKEQAKDWYKSSSAQLKSLVTDLHVMGHRALRIDTNGVAYIAVDGKDNAVGHFNRMPKMGLWGYVMDAIVADGLFVDSYENQLHVTWA